MRLPLVAAMACLTGAGLVLPALAEDADPDDLPRAAPAPGSVTMHALPDGEGASTTAPAPAAAPAATGSVDTTATPPAAPPPPLAGIGRAVREALKPLSEDEPVTPPPGAGKPKPPTQAEASELSLHRDQAAIAAFYAARNDAPVWVNKWGLEPRALEVIAEIDRAAYWGLDPRDFELPSIGPGLDGGPELPEADLVKAEQTMALVVLKYARYARGGAIAQPDRQLSSFYDRRPSVRDRKQLLEEIAAAAKPGAYLAAIHPQHEQFKKLHQAWLEAKRLLKLKSGKIPPGADVKPGDRTPQVVALRKRMDVPASPGFDETLYDEALVHAVSGFQFYRGIEPADGTVDAATRDALAKPIKGNADQLLANMQAWRYMPDDMGDFYVWLNIPEYTVRIVEKGDLIWTERATTGLVNKQTPVFSDEIERVTFRPKWRVPDSIKVKEVWPSLLSGGGMMRQHGLVMEDRSGNPVDWRSINWAKANMEDYTLWQPPGGKNQLGVVRFSFPSKHRVYMHDTPDKYMFAWSRRAVSHGCMRIRNPLEMATIILGHDQGWDRARADDAVANGPEHNIVELNRKVPVHITYFTARIGDKGKIETWADVYGHERRLKLALAGKWSQIDVPTDHLAPLDQTRVPGVASAQRRPRQKEDTAQSVFNSVFGGF